jgi:hypothetical protein
LRTTGSTFAFLAVAIALRGVFLLLDLQPRFLLGDSESYLATQVGGWIPNDRSWVYGLFINQYLEFSHSLSSLVLFQSLLTAVSFALLASVCARLGVRESLCWAVLVLASVEPVHLYCDRALLTDSPGAALLLLGFLALLAHLVRPTSLSAIAAAGLLALALVLRTAFVPVILFAALYPLALVALRWVRSRRSRRAHSRAGLASALALAGGVILSMAVYAQVTGRLTGAPSSLNPRSGYFLLGTFAPLLAPSDFEGLGVANPKDLLLATDSKNRELRNTQVYAPEGIDLRLERELGDWRRVSRAGSIVVRRAALRDPLGFVNIVASNSGDYLTPARWGPTTAMDLGIDRTLPPGMVAKLASLVWEGVPPELPARTSPVLRWNLATRWTLPLLCWAALLLPLGFAVLARRIEPGERTAATFCALATLLYLMTVFTFSVDVGSRYLLPVQPLLLLLAALLLEGMLRHRVLGMRTPDPRPRPDSLPPGEGSALAPVLEHPTGMPDRNGLTGTPRPPHLGA